MGPPVPHPAKTSPLGEVSRPALPPERRRRQGRAGAYSTVFSTPRRIWSSSIDSNRALKLPSPKPSLPLRWMISKKIGPIWFSVKICSSRPPPGRRRAGCGSSAGVTRPRRGSAGGGPAVRSRSRAYPGTPRRSGAALRPCRRYRRSPWRYAGCLRRGTGPGTPGSGLVRAFLIDRNADIAARRGHGLGLHARDLAFDVEIAHFAEVEQALVELRPFGHAALVHVVRQVVHQRQARAAVVQVGLGVFYVQRHEVHVIDADVADAPWPSLPAQRSTR